MKDYTEIEKQPSFDVEGEIKAKVRFWQEFLGLGAWELEVHVQPPKKFRKAHGKVNAATEMMPLVNKCRIYFPDDTKPGELEITVVHEVIHVLNCRMWWFLHESLFCSLEPTAQKLARGTYQLFDEAATEALAKALVTNLSTMNHPPSLL